MLILSKPSLYYKKDLAVFFTHLSSSICDICQILAKYLHMVIQELKLPNFGTEARIGKMRPKCSSRPVYTCNFCCDFQCDFLLLIDVNEWINNECAEGMLPHLNICDWFTRSHP